MKNFRICILIIILILGGVGGYTYYKNFKEKERIEEIKKGWYIEIISDSINIRTKPNRNSSSLGNAKKGEVYKVLDVNLDNTSLFWYQVEYGKKTAWIASKRTSPWVKDVNNPNDIATPIIKFKENTYKVFSINDINYKHLEIIEDTDDYEITHVVYHEVDLSRQIDQYWILYTITDGAGKSSSKMQKIEFDETPLESQVLDFSKYKR